MITGWVTCDKMLLITKILATVKKPIFSWNNIPMPGTVLNVLETISKEKNLAVAMEIKTREEEVKTLTLSNKLIKTYTWSAAIIALLVTVVAVLFFRSGQKSKKNNLLLQSLNNEIKQQQKEAQYAFEQAVVANKEKDRLLHVIAHDLRNPLTGISSLAEIMKEQTENEKLLKYVNLIANASQRSTAMVDDLLQQTDSKTIKLALKEISLNTLLQECVSLLSYRANEKAVELCLQLPEKDIKVSADFDKLQRVVSNLVHNAIKFSMERGKVDISLSENDKVHIIVKDNGIGMSTEIMERLLEGGASVVRIGTSGERSYGLGWNICKEIVHAHMAGLSINSLRKLRHYCYTSNSKQQLS